MTMRQTLAIAAVALFVIGLALLLLRERLRFGAIPGVFLVGLSIGSFATASVIPLSSWEIYGVE
jgi:hypothetical protein